MTYEIPVFHISINLHIQKIIFVVHDTILSIHIGHLLHSYHLNLHSEMYHRSEKKGRTSFILYMWTVYHLLLKQ